MPHGHVEAVLGTIRELGLDRVISSSPCRQRDLAVAMIVARILFPSSKLATSRLWHTCTLAKRHLSGSARVLYDVSSSFYYGRHCTLALLGHDRDGKRHLPIIGYGLLTDGEGRPVAVSVYPGNTGDPKTVPEQVTKLKEQFDLAEVVLVGDRGMLTKTQLEALGEHPGLGWISALRSSAIRKLIDDGPLQLSLFEERDLAEIASPDFPGERLVACFKPLLAEERRRKREELLEETEKQLGRTARDAARRTRSPLTDAELGLKAGRVVNRFKVAKHLT